LQARRALLFLLEQISFVVFGVNQDNQLESLAVHFHVAVGRGIASAYSFRKSLDKNYTSCP
jgi:hypothetical protein